MLKSEAGEGRQAVQDVQEAQAARRPQAANEAQGRMAAQERLIFHVDVNSAFLSWSAVHRLEQDPNAVDLRTIPSIVGGDRETRHGIVTAKSIPAAKLGIRTADPVVKALQKCPDLVIVPSDFNVYRRYSRAFIKILKKYAPVVEQASIDEAYMDVTSVTDRAGAQDLAGRIRDEVRGTLGFTVNVGISVNKLLAKMASDFEKPDKTHTLFPEEIREKMWPLAMGDLYGCGKQTAARLRSLGIHTIGDAAILPLSYLQSVLGEKGGEYIWRASNGISESPVSDVREEAKSYSNEITTAHDITKENYDREVPELIEKLSTKVSSRLQRDGVFARTIGVVIKTSDFKRHSMQIKGEDSVNSKEVIEETALKLCARLMLGEKGVFARGLGVRLIGVTSADLDHGEYRQMSLLDMLMQPAGQAEGAGNEAESEGQAEGEGAGNEAESREQAEGEGAGNEAESREQAEGTGNEAKLRGQAEGAGNEAEPREQAVQEEAQRKRKDKEERLKLMEQKIRSRFGADSVRRGGNPPGQR